MNNYPTEEMPKPIDETKMYRLVDKIRRSLEKHILSSGNSIRVIGLQPLILQYTDSPIMTGGYSLYGDDIIFRELDWQEEYSSLSFIAHHGTDIQTENLSDAIKEIVEENRKETVERSVPEKRLLCFIFTKKGLNPYERRIHYLKELLSICSVYASNDFLDISINRSEFYKSDIPNVMREGNDSDNTSDILSRWHKNFDFLDKAYDFDKIFKKLPNLGLWFVAGELLLPFEARCKAIIENKTGKTLAHTAQIPYELIECLISEPYMNFSAQMLKLNREEIEEFFRSKVEVRNKYPDVA